MIRIKLSIQSKEKEIEDFLNELKNILCGSDFDVDRDFMIIRSRKRGKEQFSTPYTLLDLNYDSNDVVDRLKELTVNDYSETLIDKDNCYPLLLFVFGKDINSRLVYIKLKIKGSQLRRVLCVSFHYAEEKMNFPFR